MEKKPPKPMTPFDELVTPPHLQMLKLFLPYTPASNQQFLGVFIKFMELQQTISVFRNWGGTLHSQAFSQTPAPSPVQMFQDFKPYLPPQASEMMDTFMNMMNIMEMAQMFQDVMPDQSAGMPDNTASNSGPAQSAGPFSGGFNPMDMMMGMLNPEQQNMFQMYNTMFSDDMKMDRMEGDDTDERLDEQSGNEEY